MANEARDPRLDVLRDDFAVEPGEPWGEHFVSELLARLDAADPLRQPREVITGYRDQAGMVWPDEDLGQRSSFLPLEPVVEVRYGGEEERLREAMRGVAFSIEEDPDDPEWNEAVREFHRALEQPTP